MGTISLDAQFQTFTDRVAAERTHMNTLHESCTTGVKTTFENEVTAATNAKDGKLDIIRDAQRESNGLLVTTLERLVDANVDYVKKKKSRCDCRPIGCQKLGCERTRGRNKCIKNPDRGNKNVERSCRGCT